MRMLLLAGTNEARRISFALRLERSLSLVVSLAEPERRPQGFGWPVRIGGFGGEEAFRNWLLHEGVDAVVDASHPFAHCMSTRAAAETRALGIDYLRFLRPSWMPTEADRWTFLNRPEEAADHIPRGATVFLATGRRDLTAFSNLEGRRILCRIKDTPPASFPIPGGRFVFQPGPFTVEAEIRFFEAAKVDWIVTRNSGGQGSWPKLEAARALGLPVAMIRRPPQPDALKVNTVAETLNWVRRRL